MFLSMSFSQKVLYFQPNVLINGKKTWFPGISSWEDSEISSSARFAAGQLSLFSLQFNGLFFTSEFNSTRLIKLDRLYVFYKKLVYKKLGILYKGHNIRNWRAASLQETTLDSGIIGPPCLLIFRFFSHQELLIPTPLFINFEKVFHRKPAFL